MNDKPTPPSQQRTHKAAVTLHPHEWATIKAAANKLDRKAAYLMRLASLREARKILGMEGDGDEQS